MRKNSAISSAYISLPFTVLSQAVEQLKRENKPGIAQALEALGAQILRMKTLI